MAVGEKRVSEADPPPARRPMRLAEKLLHRAGKGGAGGDVPSGGASGLGASRGTMGPAGGSSRAGAGGVLTFGDVASAREDVDGDGGGASNAARWSAGALGRVGSVKFAATREGAKFPTPARDDAPARAPRGRPHPDIPPDWTLKTHAKFTSTRPFAWVAAAAGALPAAAGLRAFTGATASTSASSPDTIDDPRERVQRALCTYAYPADPLDPDAVRRLRQGGEKTRAWLERRMDDWADALVSAYGSLRVGACAAFYVVYEERVVLFCAPGVGGGATAASNASDRRLGFAIATDADRGRFRDAMDAAEVPYELAGEDSNRSRVGVRGGAGGASTGKTAGDGRNMGGAYGHGIPLEEWATEDPTAAPGWAAEGPALDSRGKPIARSPAKMGARKHPASGALLFRGAAAVHGLLCAMLEAPGGDPGGATSAPRDAPLILAPTPFAGASLRRARLRTSRAGAASAPGIGGGGADRGAEEGAEGDGTGTRTVYTAECVSGVPIPPWCASRLLEALCDEQDERLFAAFRTAGASAALNAAVAAAAGTPTPAGRNEEGEEVALERAEGYYTPRERRRAGAPSALGPRGLERVERARGDYYLQSLYD